MLIELIIEYELRKPGPSGRTWAPKIDLFHRKAKISKENIRVDYYLLLKYCTKHCSLLPST